MVFMKIVWDILIVILKDLFSGIVSDVRGSLKFCKSFLRIVQDSSSYHKDATGSLKGPVGSYIGS